MWCVDLIYVQTKLTNNLEKLTKEGNSPVLSSFLDPSGISSSVYWILSVNMGGTNLQT